MPAPTLPLWWDAGAAPPDGGGRPVLLLPDAHRCAAAWPTPLLDGLVEAGHRPVLVDLRDQGRSPWLATGAGAAGVAARYGLDDVVADVVGVLAALADVDARPPIVVGHGFGASTAFQLAQRHPDLIAGLVPIGATGWFIDPTLPGPEEPVAVGLIWRARLADPDASGAAAGRQDPTKLARALARELRLLCSADDDPGAAAALAEVERWLAWGFNPADRHRAAWVDAAPAWDHLARRCHPLAVVHGRGDPLVPLAHGERLALEAGAALAVVEESGHALTPAFIPAVAAAVAAVAAALGDRA